MAPSLHVQDILRVFTYAPLARGQLCLLKLLWKEPERWVSGAEITVRIYGENPSINQINGLMSAFGKRLRGAGAQTPGAVDMNNRFMLEGKHSANPWLRQVESCAAPS